MSFTDSRGHYKEVSCWSFHPIFHDWPTCLPLLLSCSRWDPGTPMAEISVSLSNAGGAHAHRSRFQNLIPCRGLEEQNPSAPATHTSLTAKTNEERLVLQQGSMQAISLCLTSFSHYTSEPFSARHLNRASSAVPRL